MILTLEQARRDLTAAFRTRGETANPVAFFVLVVVLFAIGMGPDRDIMSEIGPGVVWVLALLATMMALEGLFRRDFEDGSLEQMLLHGRPLFLVVLGKLIAHWCVSGLALTLISPIAAFMLQVPISAMPTLVLSLALGTPTLIMIGAIAAALTVGLGRGGLLVALIVMPFYIPVLIFGVSASLAAASGMDPLPQLIWLAVMLAAAITLAPFVVSLSLKVSHEY